MCLLSLFFSIYSFIFIHFHAVQLVSTKFVVMIEDLRGEVLTLEPPIILV
jgi:hypothetical protein